MATRCTIKIEGFELAKVYKHWDGYPESTLPWLKAFNEDFFDKSGSDVNYKFAQLLRSSVKMSEQFGLDSCPYKGWGVESIDANIGQDFEYVLHEDGTVTYTQL